MKNLRIFVGYTLIFFLAAVSCNQSPSNANETAQPEQKEVKAKDTNKGKAAKTAPAATAKRSVHLSKKEIKKIIGTKSTKRYIRIDKKFDELRKGFVEEGKWEGAKNKVNRDKLAAKKEAELIKVLGQEKYNQISKPISN